MLFEVGHLTPQQFAERFIATWDMAVPPLDFLQAFRVWTRGFLPGARELLATLRRRYRLACLSNSNAVHWERNAQDLQLLRTLKRRCRRISSAVISQTR